MGAAATAARVVTHGGSLMMLRHGVWVVAAVFALISGLSTNSPLHRLDLLAYDAIEPIFRGSAQTPEAVIVAIDDATLETLGQWPWSRAVHADMIDRLSAAGVSVIGFSVLLSEDGKGDVQLADAIHRSGRVVLPVAPRPSPEGRGISTLLPTQSIGAGAAAFGHVDVEIDPDGLVRRTFALAGAGAPHWQALALATLRIAQPSAAPVAAQGVPTLPETQGASAPAWLRQQEILLPRPDRGNAPIQVSYVALLQQDFLLTDFKDKAVFIGATASGIDGALATPDARSGRPMPAVEFHARAFEALRSGQVYQTLPPALTLALSMLFLALPAILFVRIPAIAALSGLMLLPPLVSGLSLNILQVWIPPVTALASLIVGSMLWFAIHLMQTRGSLTLALNDADATLKSIADAVITLDDEGRITLTNPVAEHLVGLSAEEARGKPIGPILCSHTGQGQTILAMVHACLESRSTVRVAMPLEWTSKNGNKRALRLTATPISGQGNGAVLAFNDVTEALAMTARLQHEATHDPLTGLPNRVLLLDRLALALSHAERQGDRIAVLFVDLDRFKRINDSLGHRAGDHVLRVAADRLRAALRTGDTVARWGGDEFIVLMNSLRDPAAAVVVATKLLDLLEREIHTDGGTDVMISCSIGISIGPQDSADSATLLSMADKAMYRSKLEGGHRYTFYAPEMDIWSRERLSMEAALHHALANKEFELFYQPQIDIANGKLVGFEALIRWRSPDGTLVRPDAFIPAAEECGLICGIGDWAIVEAMQQNVRWFHQGFATVPISVNVSARQCSDMRLVDTVRQGLSSTGLNPALLKVEVTESTAMYSAEHAAELLQDIDALGIRLSVDDFGTGYSSLSLLRRFPISELKIDRSFVDNVGRDGDDAAIVRGTIALAHGLDMRVVAEGVETDAQLRFLASQGCDVAQGYLFAKPLPAADAQAWLQKTPFTEIGRAHV